MSVRLVVLTAGKWRGKSILVKQLPFLIGRDPAYHLRPTSALVSNRHCALLARGGKVYVRDLGSTNGTILNGEKITGERELHTNDGLRVGPVDFDVFIESSPSVSQPTPPPQAKGQVPSANKEDAAAQLLSIEDANRPPSTTPAVNNDGVPAGRTAMDIPPPTEGSAPDRKKTEPASAPPPKADSSAAASDLLHKYLRRPSK
jgi:predicted component of type VI protein secretion system